MRAVEVSLSFRTFAEKPAAGWSCKHKEKPRHAVAVTAGGGREGGGFLHLPSLCGPPFGAKEGSVIVGRRGRRMKCRRKEGEKACCFSLSQ
jgi:hypothetical protein